MTQFADRTAIVTGGSRGQGAAEVRLLANRGASVLACDVLVEDGERLAAELSAEGLSVRFAALDVTKPDEWQRAVSAMLDWRGRLDALVNNAGIINR